MEILVLRCSNVFFLSPNVEEYPGCIDEALRVNSDGERALLGELGRVGVREELGLLSILDGELPFETGAHQQTPNYFSPVQSATLRAAVQLLDKSDGPGKVHEYMNGP